MTAADFTEEDRFHPIYCTACHKHVPRSKMTGSGMCRICLDLAQENNAHTENTLLLSDERTDAQEQPAPAAYSEQMDMGTWRCHKCDYPNPSLLTRCDRCHAIKPWQRAASDTNYDTCPKCGSKNVQDCGNAVHQWGFKFGSNEGCAAYPPLLLPWIMLSLLISLVTHVVPYYRNVLVMDCHDCTHRWKVPKIQP